MAGGSGGRASGISRQRCVALGQPEKVGSILFSASQATQAVIVNTSQELNTVHCFVEQFVGHSSALQAKNPALFEERPIQACPAVKLPALVNLIIATCGVADSNVGTLVQAGISPALNME